MLLGNNVLFAAAAGSVLLGTLYPLFLDALGLGKISVGPPYFDTVFVPVMAPALFLMGVGPLARWKEASLPELAIRLRWAALVSVLTALGLTLITSHFSILVAFGLLLAVWIVVTAGLNLWSRIRPLPDSNLHPLQRLRGLPSSYLGMLVAHLGVAVFVVGITMVKGYEVEKDVQMDLGDIVEIGPYTFKFKGVSEGEGPNYRFQRGDVDILRNGEFVRNMAPEKRIYLVQRNPMTNAAIDTGFLRDLYVSLGEQVGNTAWTVRVYYKPFVDWIWGGCLLMALGGVLALADKRYRIEKRNSKVKTQNERIA
jgi:cytochrome c-type biogenesis protein CcmF